MLKVLISMKLLVFIVILLFMVFGTASPVQAQLYADFTEGCSGTGVNSAIGCIPIDSMSGLLTFLLKFALGISGGVVLVMVIMSSYAILTSSGDPQKLQAAKENFVSIFTGLLLIAFSLVLLQTIGAGILGLPTF